ncbi:killer cell lectin-like receptor subfamily F member 2 [Sturnira hondurensis]|uniref:killer cell lectin-like receptor subfamily F member 2 n=1 Tax=Sturnira hondurensis TaxID=192404 RepID=UPI00187AB3C3|nr:killer cell lectin-like receptor subfamily F member 2 [Sturnira hondurensis]
MEAEDGYVVLMGQTHVTSQQRPKDFALYPFYYCILLVVGCIGILIFVVTVIGLNFSNKKMDFSKNVNSNSLAGNVFVPYVLNQRNSTNWLHRLNVSFSVIGPTDRMSCAVTTRNQVISEDCDSKFYGICQRDAV